MQTGRIGERQVRDIRYSIHASLSIEGQVEGTGRDGLSLTATRRLWVAPASVRRKHDAPSPRAMRSCGNVEDGIRRVRRQLAVGDPVADNLPRCRLSSLNRVLFGDPLQDDVQFRYFGNPTAVDFAVRLDGELHSHSLPSMLWNRWFGVAFENLRRSRVRRLRPWTRRRLRVRLVRQIRGFRGVSRQIERLPQCPSGVIRAGCLGTLPRSGFRGALRRISEPGDRRPTDALNVCEKPT